jgi:UDP-N-acetylmuramoyl-tripeptide--D-alanyl-D-alanine ligase
VIDSRLIEETCLVLETIGQLPSSPMSVSIDTRSLLPGQLFICLEGPNYDAFSFANEALIKGAAGIVFRLSPKNLDARNELANKFPDACFLSVADPLQFIQNLATLASIDWMRQREDRVLIGITGSNGKTTTKDMLLHFLHAAVGTRAAGTPGNYNNHIGVPLTVLNLENSVDYAVVEMGTNHKGEILHLCTMAHPNAGIITNVGKTHLEFLGTEYGVFEEKRALYDEVARNSQEKFHFVINADDAFLSRLDDGRAISFGANCGKAKVIYHSDFIEIHSNGHVYPLKNSHLLGRHNFSNLAAAFLLALDLLPSFAGKLIESAPLFRPRINRSSWIEKEGKHLFLDAYNANPSSMEASLSGLFDYLRNHDIAPKRCCVILGDMNELGENSSSHHLELGKFLSGSFQGSVAFIGKFSAPFSEGLGRQCTTAPSTEAFISTVWNELYLKHDYFFIKASRSLQLEALLAIT